MRIARTSDLEITPNHGEPEMKINHMLTGAVACVSLIGLTPAYAANKTAAAGKLSVAKGGVKFGKLTRAGTVTKKSNRAQSEAEGGADASGGSTGYIIGGLALAAVVGGVIAGTTTGGSAPTSP